MLKFNTERWLAFAGLLLALNRLLFRHHQDPKKAPKHSGEQPQSQN